MKTLSRLLAFGAVIAGLCVAPLHATDATYSLIGNQPATQQQWSLSIPSTLSVSGSLSVTFQAGHSGLGAIILQPAGGGSYVYSLMKYGAGTQTGSSSTSGIAAGSYTLQETFYDGTNFSSNVNANISATISW